MVKKEISFEDFVYRKMFGRKLPKKYAKYTTNKTVGKIGKALVKGGR